MKKKYADESARGIYEIYCDVWQTQGHAKSAAFIRAVCAQAVVPTIRARASAIAHEFAMFAWQTSFSPHTRDDMLKGLDLDMKHLQSRWERRLEAEAKESEHADRKKFATAGGPPVSVASTGAAMAQIFPECENNLTSAQGSENQPSNQAQQAAHIAIAQDNEHSERVQPRSGAEQSREKETLPLPQSTTTRIPVYRSALKRAILMQFFRKSSASDLDICNGLDEDGNIELPDSWKVRPDDRQFSEAYKHRRIRRKMEIAFSKIRVDLRGKGLLPLR